MEIALLNVKTYIQKLSYVFHCNLIYKLKLPAVPYLFVSVFFLSDWILISGIDTSLVVIIPYDRWSGWGLLTTDYWPYFLLTTDFWPKILLTTDFSAVEFNDEGHKRYREAAKNTDY